MGGCNVIVPYCLSIKKVGRGGYIVKKYEEVIIYIDFITFFYFSENK